VLYKRSPIYAYYNSKDSVCNTVYLFNEKNTSAVEPQLNTTKETAIKRT